MPPRVIYYNSWSAPLSSLKSRDATVPRVQWWMGCLWPIIDRPTIKVRLISQLWLSKINADSILPFDVQSCTLPWSQLVSLEWLMCIWIFLSRRTFNSLIQSLLPTPGSRCLSVLLTHSHWKPEPKLSVHFHATGLIHWTSFYFGIIHHMI